MLTILQFAIYAYIMYKLIRKALVKPRATTELNFGRLSGPFWYIVAAVFTLIWAGIFWW